MNFFLIAISLLAGVALVPARWWGNRQRGTADGSRYWSWLKKWHIYFAWGVLVLFISLPHILDHYGASPLAILTTLVLLIGAEFAHYSPAWGKWFPHVNKDTSGEREGVIGDIVDWLATKILGYYMPSDLSQVDKILRYKTLAFSLRFTLCAIPKYAIIAVVTGEPLAALFVLPMLAAGPIYRHDFAKYPPAQDFKRALDSEYDSGLMVGCVDLAMTVGLAAMYFL